MLSLYCCTNPSVDYENIPEHMEQLQELPLHSSALVEVIIISNFLFRLPCHSSIRHDG